MLKPIVALLRVLATIAFVAVGLVLIAALLPFVGGPGSYPWVSDVIRYDAMLLERIRSIVPTQIGRLDLARMVLALGFALGGATLEAGAGKLSDMTSKRGPRPARGTWWSRRRRKAKKKKATSAPVQAGVEGILSGDEKNPEDLVRLMVEAKRKLDALTRDVAFLALDVVDSTKMKIGEDRAFIEHDFAEFKKMVEGVISHEGVLKQAWTPDGAMICFDTTAHAIRAAQEVLRRLPYFNSGTRMMGSRFRVRCGVNAGRVQYDAAKPMQEMSDRVIDVAGHMQKYADPDTIFVAAPLLGKQGAGEWGFTPADTEVDGYSVAVWRGPSADSALSPTAAQGLERD